MDGEDDKHAEFRKALGRLPVPVTCYSNGAVCPWCGALHQTVTFGRNECVECERPFCFGYPDWHESKDPISWVEFPWKAFDALGGKADAIAPWQPNKRLQQIYFDKSEERLGTYADPSRPN